MDKQKNQLHDDLGSGENEKILKALEKLRDNGDIHTIPLVARVLADTKSEDVKNEAAHFLFDLKSQEALPVLLGTILDVRNNEIKPILVSACWESGLDCTKYIEFFVDLAIQADYLVCLECLTVIENIPGPVPMETLESCIKKTAATMDEDPEGKFDLVQSIWEVLIDMRAGNYLNPADPSLN